MFDEPDLPMPPPPLDTSGGMAAPVPGQAQALPGEPMPVDPGMFPQGTMGGEPLDTLGGGLDAGGGEDPLGGPAPLQNPDDGGVEDLPPREMPPQTDVPLTMPDLYQPGTTQSMPFRTPQFGRGRFSGGGGGIRQGAGARRAGQVPSSGAGSALDELFGPDEDEMLRMMVSGAGNRR